MYSGGRLKTELVKLKSTKFPTSRTVLRRRGRAREREGERGRESEGWAGGGGGGVVGHISSDTELTCVLLHNSAIYHFFIHTWACDIWQL